MGSSGQETYSFSEAIERIRTCEDLDILNQNRISNITSSILNG
jgi:hypothetical protein